MIWLASQLWPGALLSFVIGFALTWFAVVRPRSVDGERSETVRAATPRRARTLRHEEDDDELSFDDAPRRAARRDDLDDEGLRASTARRDDAYVDEADEVASQRERDEPNVASPAPRRTVSHGVAASRHEDEEPRASRPVSISSAVAEADADTAPEAPVVREPVPADSWDEELASRRPQAEVPGDEQASRRAPAEVLDDERDADRFATPAPRTEPGVREEVASHDDVDDRGRFDADPAGADPAGADQVRAQARPDRSRDELTHDEPEPEPEPEPRRGPRAMGVGRAFASRVEE